MRITLECKCMAFQVACCQTIECWRKKQMEWTGFYYSMDNVSRNSISVAGAEKVSK